MASQAVNRIVSHVGKVVITITKPVYTVNGDKKIAVDPVEMEKLVGTGVEVSQWEGKFQEVNAAGVARWEAYVLGIESEEAWQNLSMIITQGDPSAAGLSLSIPANDRELLESVEKRTVEAGDGLPPGVSAVKYELIGRSSSDAATFQPIPDEAVDEETNLRDNPNFVYLLENMSGNVQFFKIRRRYIFVNQTAP